MPAMQLEQGSEVTYRTKVRHLKARDLRWSFDSDWPVAMILGYNREKMDPFPCYAHDAELVKAEVAKLEEIVAPLVPLTFVVADFESISRVLATTMQELSYNRKAGERDKLKANAILINGKRTPQHPAVTRYLVAHEYGHALEDWIEEARELRVNSLRPEYAAIRPGSGTHHGDAQSWTSAVGEVMACDFRVAVAGVETEHWPHPEVGYPDHRVEEWWAQAIDDVRKASGQEPVWRQEALA